MLMNKDRKYFEVKTCEDMDDLKVVFNILRHSNYSIRSKNSKDRIKQLIKMVKNESKLSESRVKEILIFIGKS